MHVSVCVDKVPEVALAIVLFDLQRDGEGVEVAVGRTGQRRVPDVWRPRGTPEGCRETVQDTTDLDGEDKEKQRLYRQKDKEVGKIRKNIY